MYRGKPELVGLLLVQHKKTSVAGRWGAINVVCLTIFGTSHHLCEWRQMIVLLFIVSESYMYNASKLIC